MAEDFKNTYCGLCEDGIEGSYAFVVSCMISHDT